MGIKQRERIDAELIDGYRIPDGIAAAPYEAVPPEISSTYIYSYCSTCRAGRGNVVLLCWRLASFCLKSNLLQGNTSRKNSFISFYKLGMQEHSRIAWNIS